MARTWFVTGSSRGLGRVIATHALEQGDRVVATARDVTQLADLAERHGERALLVPLDVTDPGQAESAAERAFEHFGQVDVLVNNAGYADLASIEDSTLEAFRAQVETNFFGVVTVTKAFLPRLRRQGHGHGIEVSTLGDRVATPGQAAYQSAKWAVAGFSTALAQEVAPLGLQVTILEPGSMPTDFAGSRRVPPISAPYEPTIGPVARRVRDDGRPDARPPADLRRIAAVVHDLAGRPDAPLRLLLGADAVRYAEAAATATADTDRAWRELSLSVTPAASQPDDRPLDDTPE